MLEKMLLGTYTRRESKGIYSFVLDTEKEELVDLKLETEENSPTYLARSAKGNLYTVTSVDSQGGIGAYDSSLTFLNAITEEGAPLCYVAVDEERQLVYGANYHKGEVNVYKILEDGSLEATDAVYHDEPLGPHENQDRPHAHYSDLTPDKRLAVCDLGTDRVYTYDVSEEGKLTEVATYVAPAGTGPRHLVFHPNTNYAYLFGELDSSVTVLAYDGTNGTFEEQQKLSTLPEDFEEFNAGAAIRMTSDGRFIYLSNRGHNSIAVFAVNEEGASLAFVEHVSSEGDHPRDFNLDPTENFVICANQNTDNLTLYRRDPEVGTLTLIKKDIPVPECVCVLFQK
ncbi:lactonase family protein [Enterococcus olivae]